MPDSTPHAPAEQPFALDAAGIARLRDWQGRSETLSDQVTAQPVAAMGATLNMPAGAATALPPLWHWLYFLPHHRQDEIGEDGHARRGGFLPPVPLPRRMWAGGRLRWEPGNPLHVGQKIDRRSTILSVAHKAGRTGELVFVTVRHEIFNAQGLALSEEHDIVYRSAARPGDPAPPPVPAETGAAWQRDMVADPVLLFRYSALTLNSHRIHYDRPYATQVEAYPDLVVHGPLQATLMLDLAVRHGGRPIASFDFRGVAAALQDRPLAVCGRSDAEGADLWTEQDGGRRMVGRVTWGPPA